MEERKVRVRRMVCGEGREGVGVKVRGMVGMEEGGGGGWGGWRDWGYSGFVGERRWFAGF